LYFATRRSSDLNPTINHVPFNGTPLLFNLLNVLEKGILFLLAMVYGILPPVNINPFNVPNTEINIPKLINFAPDIPNNLFATNVAGALTTAISDAVTTLKYATFIIR